MILKLSFNVVLVFPCHFKTALFGGPNDLVHGLVINVAQLLLKHFKALSKFIFEQQLSPVGHHGDANEVQKCKSVVVCQQGVPNPDHIRYTVLLSDKKHQPAQRVEVCFQANRHEVFMQLRVNPEKQVVKLPDFTVNSGCLFIQLPD